jgi:hypothetical protein
MNTQDFLTYAFDLIAFGYASLMLLNFIDGIGGDLWEIFYPEKTTTPQEEDMPRTKIPQVSPGQLSLFDINPEPFPQMPDPWTLPVNDAIELIAAPQKPAKSKPKPLLLLPQAKEISTQPPLPATAEPTLDELLAGLDINNLQLRPARKLAKLLNIPQKLNSKDKPLGFLRAQIKAKLQQPQELPPEAIEAVRRELLAS